MFETIAKWLKDSLPKMTTIHWLVVSALIGGLLWGPASLLAQLGVADLVGQYRPYLAGILLLSLVPTIAGTVLAAADNVRSVVFRRRAREKLHSLSTDEKLLLIQYVANDSKTEYFDPMDGVVAGLQLAGILYRASSVGNTSTGFAYNITDWSWRHLRSHANLLTDGLPRDADGHIPRYKGARLMAGRLSQRM